jgi:glycosyltransferase involved in cell wall biosynthesis
LVRALFRLVLAGPGTRVILQNADDAALFRSARLVDPASMRMIPSSGVDCDRFKPHPPVADPRISGCPAEARRFRVLLPTRLLWHKGLAEYVEAGRLLRAEGRAVDLLLAGEPDPGNPASVPATTVREWVKRGWVQWLGYVEDMASLLRTVDAVVFPSYREGLPKGLAEGAAAGLPLIATNVPGCRDVVTDGVEGLLVPPRDGPALAAAIRRLQDDPELRARMGAAASAKALAEYDERIVIQRTFAVYQELLPGFR